MASAAVAGSFFMMAATMVAVLVKEERPTAMQVSLSASIIGVLLVGVDAVTGGGIPAMIFVPVALVLLVVMIGGAIQGYGVQPDTARSPLPQGAVEFRQQSEQRRE